MAEEVQEFEAKATEEMPEAEAPDTAAETPSAAKEAGGDAPDAAPQTEEIKFQRIMEYKAYRRGMYLKRIGIAIVLAAALAVTWIFSPFFGVVLPLAGLIVVAISIIVSMGSEQTYNVYNTRVVIKRRSSDKRTSVPLGNIVSVKYKSAFYEKRMCTGTVTIFAKVNGKVKKFKLKHILNAQEIVDYLSAFAGGTNAAKG